MCLVFLVLYNNLIIFCLVVIGGLDGCLEFDVEDWKRSFDEEDWKFW